MLIGQDKLMEDVHSRIIDGRYPRFSIVVGENGSEKNLVGYEVAKRLHANYVCVEDVKVDTIRNMIVEAYTVKTPTVYNIINADGMSIQARNSLLKVTEEPPNKAYFVLVLEDENNTLPTIKSRGQIFKLAPYTAKDLIEYSMTVQSGSADDVKYILKLCETPGDVDTVYRYNPAKFYEFVEKVVDNIAVTNGCNSFKISSSIAFKDEEDKYDLKLFWRAFCNVCLDKKYLYGILVTSRYMSQLKVRTINKSMLFDMWILDIRQEWTDGSK